jgi:hypothetical protein
MWAAILHVLGVEPRTPSTAYNFWSGFGSDIGEVGIIGGLAHMARARNCHVKGCWRIGRHPHGPFRVCAKHHPSLPDTVTHATVRAHRAVGE